MLTSEGNRVTALCYACCVLAAGVSSYAVLDQNGNQQGDIWEARYGAWGLAATSDADGDHVSNAGESIAGTDPFQISSVPEIQMQQSPTSLVAQWSSFRGKVYELQSLSDFSTGTWQTLATLSGADAILSNSLVTTTDGSFRRIVIKDTDTDSDLITDWEELQLGFNPKTNRTDRYEQTDNQRIIAGMTNTNTVVTCALLDGNMYERWPDAGLVAIRRTGGLKAITVNFSLAGSATRDVDYTTQPGNSVVLPLGVREAWIEFQPVVDALDAETNETITLTLSSGAGYVLGTAAVCNVTIGNETAASLPNPKAAARFLVQAAFGPDQDDSGDADQIPENVEAVTAMGFSAWIDDQFTRPVGLIQPFTEYAPANLWQFYLDPKEAAWWNRAMGVPSLIPGGPVQFADPLRQRVAFALSQIVVVSDRQETLAVNPGRYGELLRHDPHQRLRELPDSALQRLASSLHGLLSEPLVQSQARPGE